MKTAVVHGQPRIRVVAFDKGDEVIGTLTRLCKEAEVRSASISAIGAFDAAVLAYFDRATNAYKDIPVDEQVEVVALQGNLAHRHGEPIVHLHAVLGRSDGTTLGGHLSSGRVWPTLEMYLIEGSRRVTKRDDAETGLRLLDLGDLAK
jgi:uncharacterized protein